MSMTWEAYEDNGGGLYLVVLEDAHPVRILENWEYGPRGELANAVRQLADEPDAYKSWDGDLVKRLDDDAERYGMQIETIESLYRNLVAGRWNELIADSDGVYTVRMGAAGHHAFDM